MSFPQGPGNGKPEPTDQKTVNFRRDSSQEKML